MNDKIKIAVAFAIGFGLGLLVSVNDVSQAYQPTPVQQYNVACLKYAAYGCNLAR